MKIDGKEMGSLFLAPMAGVTDVGFRTVCKMAGADLTYTEMVNATALLHNNEKTKHLLLTTEIETPKVVQIFGHDASDMAKVCSLPYLEEFDMIDINFGCPAPKIVKNGDGSALLKTPKKIAEIVSACAKSSSKPISCKIRKGFGASANNAVEIAKICEEAGAKMLTVHGRTREQMYSGNVDLETIAKVKQSIKIPVVGNGDVVDMQTYKDMLSTGVDGVMIARGALGNPNLFADLKGQQKLNELELIKKQIETLKNYFDDRYINATMRKHLLWYISGKQDATKIKLQVATCADVDQGLKIIEDFYNLQN